MMMMIRLLFLLFAIAVATTFGYKRYDGYELLHVYPSVSTSHVKVMDRLRDDIDIDFWYEGRDRFDLFVPPHKLSDLKKHLTKEHIRYIVKSTTVQSDIEEELRRLSTKKPQPGRAIDYYNFNNYADIMGEVDDLAARGQAAGLQTSTFSIGSSVQGRDLKGLSIIGSGPGRRTVWIDATIHAREWLATATILLIMSHLVDDYGSDAQVKNLVDTYDWYLLPIVNPDGYFYTWSSDRMWRKSRNTNPGSTCIGTDLNRNYAEQWGNAGTSNNPCSDTFGGAGPGSEVETQALQNQLLALQSSLLTTIHLHTYGQLWLIPWGSVTSTGACNFASDNADMMVVANAAANAIQATYGTSWARGNSCATIYPASGITPDFAKARAGCKYTATPELRGGSFVVQPSQIILSFNEVWNGVAAAVLAVP